MGCLINLKATLNRVHNVTQDVTEGILEKLDMSEDDLERLVEAQLNTHAISLSCIR